MLLTAMAMAMTIQLAAPAGAPQLEIPDSALRDPYGFMLSNCSPLVRSRSESLEACERRVGEALRARLPDFHPRPAATVVASGADDPPTAATGTAFGGRCTTRQDSQRSEDGSSSTGVIVCGDEAAADVLLRNLDVPRRPAPEPCDRPATLETHEAWIARCRALPQR